MTKPIKVPTTKQVREAADVGFLRINGDKDGDLTFDAWLRDHDAEVLEKATVALRENVTGWGVSFYADWLEDRSLKIAEGKLTDE